MKKKIITFMFCFVMLSAFAFIFSFNSIYADGETKNITFEDENLYNAIKDELQEKIESYDDTTKTITMTQENIESVETLHLSKKNIVNISGLNDFKNISILNLHSNNIEDLSSLSQLRNLVTLDLTQNKITDISPLANLTNMETLYLGHTGFTSGGGSNASGGHLYSSNTISNLQPLEQLTKIKVLEIAGIGVKDISVLENLVNLRVLDATSNDIEDITALSGLNNLYCLILHDNKNIRDFEPISCLTGLTRLSIGNIGVSDITFLSNLTNLTELNLSYNDITDITPLSNLVNLKELSMGNNPNLEDISPLAQCTNLKELFIPNDNISNIDSLKNTENLKISILGNRIDNLNVVDEGTINFADAYWFIFELNSSRGGWLMEKHPQLLYVETYEKEITLPRIFIQAQDEESKIYTDQEFQLVNCTLNDSKDKVILDDDINEATVTIRGGNISGTRLTIKYDNTPPDLEVTYSDNEMPKGTVTATITANEEIQEVEGWTLSEDGKSITKIYTEDTTQTVRVYDLVGNYADATVKVIIPEEESDTTPPALTYETKRNDDGSLDVTLIADEEIREVEGWTLSEDRKSITKRYTEAIVETVRVYDLAGNYTDATITVTVIGAGDIEDEEDEVTEDDVVKVEIEEAKENPSTGNTTVYVVLSLIVATVGIAVSTIYLKRKSNLN